jgi:hypothetical protein
MTNICYYIPVVREITQGREGTTVGQVKSIKRSILYGKSILYVNLTNGGTIAREIGHDGNYGWTFDRKARTTEVTADVMTEIVTLIQSTGIESSTDKLNWKKLPFNDAIWTGKFDRRETRRDHGVGDGHVFDFGDGRRRWID